MNRKTHNFRIIALGCLFVVSFAASSCLNPANRWTGSPGIILTRVDDITHIERIVPQTLRGDGTLLEGDIVYAIEDIPLSGVTIQEARSALRGPVGSAVRITVQRNGKLEHLSAERIILKKPEKRILWIRHISTDVLPQAPIPAVDDSEKPELVEPEVAQDTENDMDADAETDTSTDTDTSTELDFGPAPGSSLRLKLNSE